MTDRFERRLPEILTRISAPQVPDYTDDILGLTARRRQRPGWTFPGRWLPMDIAAPRPSRGPDAMASDRHRDPSHPRPRGGRPRLHRLEAPAPRALLRPRSKRLIRLCTGMATSTSPTPTSRASASLSEGPRAKLWRAGRTTGRTLLFGRVVPGGSVVMAADADGRNVRQLNSNVVSGTTTEAFCGFAGWQNVRGHQFCS